MKNLAISQGLELSKIQNSVSFKSQITQYQLDGKSERQKNSQISALCRSADGGESNS